MTSHLRRMWRAALTPGAILSLEEVAEALPGRPEDTVSWVTSNVAPSGEVAGARVYRWGDVVERVLLGREPVATASVWIRTEEAAQQLGVSRATLDEMVGRAPKGLPGAPVPVGRGGRRRHLRWDASGLDVWMAAFTAWESETPTAHSRHGRRSTGSHSRRVSADDGVVDWVDVARGARSR